VRKANKLVLPLLFATRENTERKIDFVLGDQIVVRESRPIVEMLALLVPGRYVRESIYKRACHE